MLRCLFMPTAKKDVVRPLPCSSFPTATRCGGLAVWGRRCAAVLSIIERIPILAVPSKRKGMTSGHAFPFDNCEELKCAGRVNCPCAKIFAAGGNGLYGAKAPRPGRAVGRSSCSGPVNQKYRVSPALPKRAASAESRCRSFGCRGRVDLPGQMDRPGAEAEHFRRVPRRKRQMQPIVDSRLVARPAGM